MRERKEHGAVVVEAIISMTAFMFAILIILSIADIAYVQSKMAVSLNSAAEEISQYCYLYYKFQLDDLNKEIGKGTEAAEKTVNDTVDGLGQMMDSFGGAGNDFRDYKFTEAVEQLEAGATAANKTVTDLFRTIADDPKAFLVGMGKLAGRELTEAGKVYLGQLMAKAFMEKNLRAASDDDPDDFLRRLHVVDGMDGLDFQYTSLMAYGSSNEIALTCTYQVSVIRLLNFEYKFTFCQSAKTLAWGDGISLVTPRSIWTSMAPMARGKYIVSEEKKGYRYTSSGDGYDALVNSGGKNEFVTITSIDSSSASYQTVDAVSDRLNREFTSMQEKVSKLPDSVTVWNNNKKEKTVVSDPATRTYRIVLVLPEKTTEDYKDIVKQAISHLQERNPDAVISVDIKEGYGALPEKAGKESGGEE